MLCANVFSVNDGEPIGQCMCRPTRRWSEANLKKSIWNRFLVASYFDRSKLEIFTQNASGNHLSIGCVLHSLAWNLIIATWLMPRQQQAAQDTAGMRQNGRWLMLHWLLAMEHKPPTFCLYPAVSCVTASAPLASCSCTLNLLSTLVSPDLFSSFSVLAVSTV